MINLSKNSMNGYVKTFWTTFELCSNWFSILCSKLFNTPIKSIKLRSGTVFLTAGGRLGKADMTMLGEIWFHEYYNPPFLSLKEDDVVFDIGANNGYFTVYAARKVPRGKVYAFEPVPALADLVGRNAETNHLKNIVVEKAAMFSKNGDAEFHVSREHNGCHSLYERGQEGEIIHVGRVTLDEYCAKQHISTINFLKMDCEGAEYEIILNLSPETLSKIEKIAMEVHDDVTEHKHDEIINFLRKHNFKVAFNGFLYAINAASGF